MTTLKGIRHIYVLHGPHGPIVLVELENGEIEVRHEKKNLKQGSTLPPCAETEKACT